MIKTNTFGNNYGLPEESPSMSSDGSDYEERFAQELFNSLPLGVVYQNPDGMIIRANPAAERIFGLTLDQMQGLTSMDPRWRAIREDGSNFPGEEHPISVALHTGVKVENYIHGIFNPVKNRFVWLRVTAIPLFRDGEKSPFQAYAIIEDITEQRKANENFRMLFREMLEGFAVHEIIVDTANRPVDYRFIDVNPAFERMTGLRGADIIGRTVREVISETEPVWIERYGNVALTGIPIEFEQYSHGLDKYFKVSAFRPALNQFACIFTDITDRIKNEEKLQNAVSSSEKHVRETRCLYAAARAIMENNAFDSTARVIFDACCEATGAKSGYIALLNQDGTENEVLFLEAGNLPCSVDPSLPMPIRGLRAIAYETGLPVFENDFMHSEHVRFMPKGHVILTNILFAPLNVDGKVIGVMGLANRPEDFTDDIARIAAIFADLAAIAFKRTRAEEALCESRESYRALVEGLPDIVMQFDSEYRYLYVSENVSSVVDFTAEQFIGKTHRELGFSEEQCNFFEDAISEVFKTGRPNEREFTFEGKHGPIVFNWRLLPIFDAQKNVISVLSVSRNITELKRLQAELVKTQKLESLGILAGGIAHDFNNLLGGIFGYIDMAMEGMHNGPDAPYLAKALGAIESAKGLTRQLLTFAKGGEPAKKPGKLIPFIREAAEFALSGSIVDCTFNLPDDLWTCEFDKDQIGQVIGNIVINAQQAMPTGGAVIISAYNAELPKNEAAVLAAGKYVVIKIEDHGIGIPSDLLSRIFDPFFTTKPKGRGLGLATCYSIIKKHGGAIDVASTVGTGTAFTIYLPAVPNAFASAGTLHFSKHRGSGTILIMDDEEVLLEIMKRMLVTFGYSVVCTKNSNETLEYIAAARERGELPVAMIFDLTIPGGQGGKETAAEIRKIDTKTPIFVASGYADNPVMANPTAWGFTASICKPFLKNDLAELLERHMVKKLEN